MGRRSKGTGAAAAAMVALAAGAAETDAQTVAALSEHRWKHRVVVVLAADTALPAYRAQMAELARHREALAERDVRIVSPTAGEAIAATLRRQLGVADGAFRVVLVGKDGGAKLRRRAPITADELLRTIDGMPMGAAEARRRGS